MILTSAPPLVWLIKRTWLIVVFLFCKYSSSSSRSSLRQPVGRGGSISGLRWGHNHILYDPIKILMDLLLSYLVQNHNTSVTRGASTQTQRFQTRLLSKVLQVAVCTVRGVRTYKDV